MQPTNPDQFTDKAWDAIVKAQDVARRFRQQYLEVEHVVIALLEQQGLAGNIFTKMQLDPAQVLRHPARPSASKSLGYLDPPLRHSTHSKRVRRRRRCPV